MKIDADYVKLLSDSSRVIFGPKLSVPTSYCFSLPVYYADQIKLLADRSR